MRAQSGQGLLEFVIALGLAASLVLVGATLLRSQWDRFRCAYLTFEATHARLVGMPRLLTSARIQLDEDQVRVRGKGSCGNAREEVELLRLEATGW